MQYKNSENITAFEFNRNQRLTTPGVSAMIRVKNEASKIQLCLESISEVFDEIILVDNASTDQTAELVKAWVNTKKQAPNIKLLHYPFQVARCGEDHFATAEDSVHSLAYYYNWTLSHCTYAYVCKWDADMILRSDMKQKFRAFLDQLSVDKLVSGILCLQTLYRNNHGQLYKALGEINKENRIFPNLPEVRFKKARLWETLTSTISLQNIEFANVCGFELKFSDEDEFSHWTRHQFETPRKKQEWANFQAIKAGNISTQAFESLGDHEQFFDWLYCKLAITET